MQLLYITIFALFVFGSFHFSKKVDQGLEKELPKLKRCPMHAWKYHEQPGVEPAVFYIKCDWCNKTPSEVSAS